jgi:hypothetical protein
MTQHHAVSVTGCLLLLPPWQPWPLLLLLLLLLLQAP